MRTKISLAVLIGTLLTFGPGTDADARKKKKLKTPPSPMNKEVKFEVYENTDIAQLTYRNYRREFRVGYPPYPADRFHVAEFVFIAENTRKYLRPDLKAEIKMAPQRTQPALMANKVFQKKWKGQLAGYEKLKSEFTAVRAPQACKPTHQAYLQAMDTEIFLGRSIAETMFAKQEPSARQRLREALQERFRSHNPDQFDALLAAFEQDANLADFYPKFSDLFVEAAFSRARKQAEETMQSVGLEYAEAVKEEDGLLE